MVARRASLPPATMSGASFMRMTGICAVVLGGLVAALTDPLDLARGSWVAAYLVLVVGVAQGAMGTARQRWEQGDGGRWRAWLQLALWNLGSVAVIIGTLLALVSWVYVGSGLLVVALVLAFESTRQTHPTRRRWVLIVYRLLLVLLAVSILVGVFLSSMRHL